jgi:hypothetical protein
MTASPVKSYKVWVRWSQFRTAHDHADMLILLLNTPCSGVLDEHGELSENGPIKFKTHSQGSATTLAAALDPNIDGRSGAYLCDCKVDHDEKV